MPKDSASSTGASRLHACAFGSPRRRLLTCCCAAIAVVFVYGVATEADTGPKTPLEYNGETLYLPGSMEQGPEQVRRLLEAVDASADKQVLIFSMGHDSPFWYEEVVTKRGGELVFLEDNFQWYLTMLWHYPYLPARLVSYSTVIEDDAERLKDGSEWCDLRMSLPDAVTHCAWDVVLVDGPRGDLPTSPGRFQPIFEAARLVKPDGAVFVDDCNRDVERDFGQLFLGHDNFEGGTERSAHANTQCMFRMREPAPAGLTDCSHTA